MRSWTVGFWDRFFEIVSWVSLFRLLRPVVRPLSTPGGVEVWVTGHLLLAFAAASYSVYGSSRLAVQLFMWYGALRVFEIIVYQTNVLLFDQLRAHRNGQQYALEGYTRIILLLMQNYLEIVLWFAVAISYFIPEVGVDVHRTLPELLANSFANFTGFGPSVLKPDTTGAQAWIWAESAAGLFMSIVVLARFISILPAPRSKTPGEWQDD